MRTIVFFLLFIPNYIGYAQFSPYIPNYIGHQFSQFNAAPLLYNPGYAGSAESPRLAFNSSYIKFPQSSVMATTHVSYDQVVKRLHGAAGMSTYHSYNGYIGDNSYYYSNFFHIDFVYAAKFNIAHRVCISPAIKIGYNRSEINYSFSEYYGPFKITGQAINMSLGTVVNTKKLHAGFTVDYSGRLYDVHAGYSIQPVNYIGQFGYTFQTNSNISITPSFLFKHVSISQNTTRRGYNFTIANLSFRYKFMLVGVCSNPSIMLGYYSKKMIIGYSFFDYPRKPSNHDYRNHEISLRYLLAPAKEEKQSVKKQRPPRKKKRILQTD